MSVLTPITESELTNFLSHYDLGRLQQFRGIEEGTVNTNYLLTINQQSYILTIFESLTKDLANRYLELTDYLSSNTFACASAVLNNQAELIGLIKGKPACLVHFLSGASKSHPSPNDCFQIGKCLANLHQTTNAFPTKLSNPMDSLWRKKQSEKVFPHVPKDEQNLIKQALALQEQIPWDKLPKSTIHYDFFRDNVFFQDNKLSGVIDFYYACYDAMLLDLVIAINDWCTNWQDPDLKVQSMHFQALIDGYQTIRPLARIEKDTLYPLLQVMSFHFWLSRKLSQIAPPEGEKITLKDPNEFKRIYMNWLTSSFSSSSSVLSK